jgi:hypothetical protein
MAHDIPDAGLCKGFDTDIGIQDLDVVKLAGDVRNL